MRHVWVRLLVAVQLGKEVAIFRTQHRLFSRQSLGDDCVDVQTSAQLAQPRDESVRARDRIARQRFGSQTGEQREPDRID